GAPEHPAARTPHAASKEAASTRNRIIPPISKSGSAKVLPVKIMVATDAGGNRKLDYSLTSERVPAGDGSFRGESKRTEVCVRGQARGTDGSRRWATMVRGQRPSGSVWRSVDRNAQMPTLRHMSPTTGLSRTLKLARRRQGVRTRELAKH